MVVFNFYFSQTFQIEYLPDKAECLPELDFADCNATLSDCREADCPPKCT